MTTEVGRVAIGLEIDPSKVAAGMSAAKSTALAGASDIEKSINSKLGGGFSDLSAGLNKSLSSGNFGNVGSKIGGQLVGGISQSFGALGGVAGSVATALGPVGIAAGVASAAIIGIGASSVGVASNFQSSMSKVNSVIGGSQADFDKLSQAARDAGATTTFSASQAADALYYLASAGYSSDDSVAALGATLNLAGAGGMDLARASEMLTTDLAVYGLTAKDATMVTDLLAAAASASNSGVGQMGDALALVGGTAKALGIDITETTTILALMANGGTKAAEAGHKLNSILGELTQASGATATKAQATAMAEMGITADQLNPTLHSQAEIFGLLHEKHMTSAQSLMLFGKENNSVTSYLADNIDKYHDLNGKVTEAGKAAEMNAMMNENLAGAYAQMSSAVEEAQISIGNLLLPALTSIVNVGTSVIGAATSIGHSFYAIVTSSQAFGAVASAFESMGEAGSAAFENLISVVEPAWEAIGGGSTVMAVVQAAFNAISAPITIFFTVLGKTADAAKALYTAISPVASAIGDTLGNAIKTTQAYLQAFEEAITDLVSSSSTVQTLTTAFDGLKTKLSEIGSFWADIASKVVSGLTTAIPTALSGLISAMDTLMGGAGEAASTAFDNAIQDSPLGALFGFAGGISARAAEIMDAGDKAADKVADGVKSNEDLQTAAAEALQTPEALAAAEEAGGKIAEKTMSAFAKTASNLGISDEAYLGILNAQDSSNAKIRQQNLLLNEQEYTLQAIIGHQGTNYELLDKSGKVLSSTGIVYTAQLNEFSTSLWAEAAAAASSSENSAALQAKLDELDASFQSGKISAAEYNSDLADIAGSMRLIDFKSSLWDTANTQKNWTKWLSENKDVAEIAGEELSLVLYNVMNSLGDDSSEAIAKWADSMGISFEAAQATLKEDLDLVMAALANPGSIDATRLNAAIADLIDSNYISSAWGNKISSGATEAFKKFETPIANAGKWVESEFQRMASEASDAWQDGLTQDEADAIAAFGPELEYIKTTYPALYEQYGGEAMERLIAAIEANGGDVEAAMAEIGKLSGESFKTNLLGGAAMDTSLSALIADPEKVRSMIVDKTKYAYNSALPELESYMKEMYTQVTNGADPSLVAQNYLNEFAGISDLIPKQIWNDVLQVSEGKKSFEDLYNDYTNLKTAFADGTVVLTSNGYALVSNDNYAKLLSNDYKGLVGTTVDYATAKKGLTEAMSSESTQSQSLRQSVSTLNTQYKNNQITQEEFKSGIVDLYTSKLPKASIATTTYGDKLDYVSGTAHPALNSQLDVTTDKFTGLKSAVDPVTTSIGSYTTTIDGASAAMSRFISWAKSMGASLSSIDGYVASANAKTVGEIAASGGRFSFNSSRSASGGSSQSTSQLVIPSASISTAIDPLLAAGVPISNSETVTSPIVDVINDLNGVADDSLDSLDGIDSTCRVGFDGMTVGLGQDLMKAGIYTPSTEISAALSTQPDISAYQNSLDRATEQQNGLAYSCLTGAKETADFGYSVGDATSSVNQLSNRLQIYNTYLDSAGSELNVLADGIYETSAGWDTFPSSLSETSTKLHTLSVDSDYLSDNYGDLGESALQCTSCLDSINNMYTGIESGSIGPSSNRSVANTVGQDNTEPTWFTSALNSAVNGVVQSDKSNTAVDIQATKTQTDTVSGYLSGLESYTSSIKGSTAKSVDYAIAASGSDDSMLEKQDSGNTQLEYITNNTGTIASLTTAGLAGYVIGPSGNLVAGSSATSSYSASNPIWGGTSVNGGGWWINSDPSSDNSAAENQRLNDYLGYDYFSAGGFSSVAAIFGEDGEEAAVPIADRQAGLKILPLVMAKLGVPTFATGGIVNGNISIPSGQSQFKFEIDASVNNCTFASDIDFEAILEDHRAKIMKEVSFLLNGGGN